MTLHVKYGPSICDGPTAHCIIHDSNGPAKLFVGTENQINKYTAADLKKKIK